MKMASKMVFIVFVLPAMFSIIFGSAVMADILQKPDRELDMWPISREGKAASHENKPVTAGSPLQILGLSKHYSVSAPDEVEIKVTDSSFGCGDSYAVLYPVGESHVVNQGGFLKQCLDGGERDILPTGAELSKITDYLGYYKVEAEMVSIQLKTVSISETFTVK